MERPNYGNWVSTKLLYIPGAVSGLFLALSFVFPIAIVGAMFFFLPFAYFAYARHKFSSNGGNIQSQVQDLVLEHLDWNGASNVLDIGCGNGPLSIKMAKRRPDARVIGIDYWGGLWEYSKEVCERNAEIAGVAGRVTFQRASASSLPFEDEFFDAAVSNFVFHEVKDTWDKRGVIKEALRVVKREGRFAFQDLFLLKSVYGEIDDLIETIKSWGIEEVEFVDTSNSDFIPGALKSPMMLGRIGIIHGKK